MLFSPPILRFNLHRLYEDVVCRFAMKTSPIACLILKGLDSLAHTSPQHPAPSTHTLITGNCHSLVLAEVLLRRCVLLPRFQISRNPSVLLDCDHHEARESCLSSLWLVHPWTVHQKWPKDPDSRLLNPAPALFLLDSRVGDSFHHAVKCS